MTPIAESFPAGPRTPAAWQLLRYSHSPLSFLEECSNRYGDPFTLRFAGYGTFVMLSDPDAVRDVFRSDADGLHSGEANQFLSAVVGESSVLVLDGLPHARQRRALQLPLKGERMRSFLGAIQQATLEAVNTWPVGSRQRMLEPMQGITLQIMLRAVLGLNSSADLQVFARMVQRLMDLSRGKHGLVLAMLLPVSLLKRVNGLPFFRQMRDLDRSLFELIDARRRLDPDERGDSILADLLKSPAGVDSTALSNQEIRDALLTLIVAGHDTTSVALAWALETIVANADAGERIREEILQVTGGSPPNALQLSRLAYLEAAIRESLRMRTILPFVLRVTKREFSAGGRRYPPGVKLCPCSHLMHRRGDLYPEPQMFRPERFLSRNYLSHEWFPFGGGHRMCVGAAFAMYQMKVVLSTVFATVDLSRSPGSRSHPIRRGIVLAPDDGVQLNVEAFL